MATCHYCEGSGKFKDARCAGTGKITCEFCKGSGKDPNTGGPTCPRCLGLTKEPCPDCNGSGQMACPGCGGKGEV